MNSNSIIYFEYDMLFSTKDNVVKLIIIFKNIYLQKCMKILQQSKS